MVQLGERLRLARLRRRLPAALVAERAGISIPTLRALEMGACTCSVGALANVLLVLGLEFQLELLAGDDELGRKLQDLNLPTRARAPKQSRRKLTEISLNDVK